MNLPYTGGKTYNGDDPHGRYNIYLNSNVTFHISTVLSKAIGVFSHTTSKAQHDFSILSCVFLYVE